MALDAPLGIKLQYSIDYFFAEEYLRVEVNGAVIEALL